MSGARPILSALGGLALVGGGMGYLAFAGPSHGPSRGDDWRPVCAKALSWDAITVERRPDPAAVSETLIYGLDLTTSNAELAQHQLGAVHDHALTLPATTSLAVLLISDDSDRSTTPDLPYESGIATEHVTVEGLPCWPNCPRETLSQQHCADQLSNAVAQETRRLEDGIALQEQSARGIRADRINRWFEAVPQETAASRSTLLRFFAKVAELPVVRRGDSKVTLVVLSDLAESKSHEQRKVQDAAREWQRSGTCPSGNWLPSLAGVNVVLLQSRVADGDRHWGEDWSALLRCAGADVTLHRYSVSIPLSEYLSVAHR